MFGNASWKTTLMGVLVIVGALVKAAQEFLEAGTVSNMAVIFTAIMTGIGLITARDNNKSSEDVGAKK